MRRTATQPPGSRAPRLDAGRVLRDPAFQERLHVLAQTLGLPREQALAEARACLDELEVQPRDRYLRWVARLARFIYSRGYDPELDVNGERIGELKALAGSRLLVFLWSHKSHLDSFVFMRALYDHGFRPQPLSFAGINMAFAGFGWLARRSGAIFLRRSFGDDPVYKLVFQAYVDYLVAERVPLSWSIEGTRSRSGKLMPPRLGLVNWVADACRRTAGNDALLVPVSISFDQIPEIDDYVAMQRGQPKRKESLRWFLGYIFGMKSRYGRIYVRFAEPVPLGSAAGEGADKGTAAIADALLAGAGVPERVKTLKRVFEVCSRIEHSKPINATDLLTLVLLCANGRPLEVDLIARRAADIRAQIAERRLPTTASLGDDVECNLPKTLARLAETSLLQGPGAAGPTGWRIAPGKELAAAYYRNTIVHYFLPGAFAEMALALLAQTGEPAAGTPPALREAVLQLRDLLKFEFFFRTKALFQQDVEAYLDARYKGWRTRPAEATLAAGPQPLFGHAILRSFVEAGFVLAAVLRARGAESPDPAAPDDLPRACLELGEELARQGRVSETALSRPLFENAARLAAHRRLLEPAAGDEAALEAARNRFAVEMDHALAAVNRLQEQYDESLRESR